MRSLSNQQSRFSYTAPHGPQHESHMSKPQQRYSKKLTNVCISYNNNQGGYVKNSDQTAKSNELMLKPPNHPTRQCNSQQFYCNEAYPSHNNNLKDNMYTECVKSDQYHRLLLYREKLVLKLHDIINDTSCFCFSFSSCKANLTAEQIKYYMDTYAFVLQMLEWHRQEIKYVNEILGHISFCNHGIQVARFNQIIEMIKRKNERENHDTNISSASASSSPNFSTMPKNSMKLKEPYRLCHLPKSEPISNERVVGKINENSCSREKNFEFYDYEKKETSNKNLSLCKRRRITPYQEKDKFILGSKTSNQCSDYAKKVKEENLINDACISLIASNNLRNVKSSAAYGKLSDGEMELSFNNNALNDSSFYGFSDDESIGELVIDENYYH